MSETFTAFVAEEVNGKIQIALKDLTTANLPDGDVTEGIGAVVTGGGSGLGEATARTLAAKGAKVAILDLGRSKGTAVGVP